jgi:hypothetical protein
MEDVKETKGVAPAGRAKNDEKVKPLLVTVELDDGTSKEYTLDFNRESVMNIANSDFKFDDVLDGTKSIIAGQQLISYALQAHHKNSNVRYAREIWEQIQAIKFADDDASDKEKEAGQALFVEIISRLIDLYTQARDGGVKNSKKAKVRL